MQEKVLEKHSDNRIYSFTIHGEHYGKNCFPSLNDLLHEAERHPQAYNRMKKQFQNIAINSIRYHLKGKKFDKVVLHYTFGEKKGGMKRDLDNIAAASRKIVNDALVACHTIKDDSPSYIVDYGTNRFLYTDKPFITVEIEERS